MYIALYQKCFRPTIISVLTNTKAACYQIFEVKPLKKTVFFNKCSSTYDLFVMYKQFS